MEKEMYWELFEYDPVLKCIFDEKCKCNFGMRDDIF